LTHTSNRTVAKKSQCLVTNIGDFLAVLLPRLWGSVCAATVVSQLFIFPQTIAVESGTNLCAFCRSSEHRNIIRRAAQNSSEPSVFHATIVKTDACLKNRRAFWTGCRQSTQWKMAYNRLKIVQVFQTIFPKICIFSHYWRKRLEKCQ